ncbi:MAG: helix-turn-helix domain-containing protein [Actinomycetota bacterium]
MNVGRVGRFIRDQRTSAKLSLRKLAGLAGVSIPYLSQIERGLRKPSADILQAIAKALRISAEQLYVQAGILEDRPVADVTTAILGDPSITEGHKKTLIQIYQAFRDEAGGERKPARTRKTAASTASATPRAPNVRKAAVPRPAPGTTVPGAPGSKARPIHRAATPRVSRASARKTGGGAASQAGSSPHPAPTRSPATNTRKEV